MSFGTSIATHFGKASAVGAPASTTGAVVATLANATLAATGTVVSPDPIATLVTALLAATSWNALYVAGTDLATSKADRSGNGLTLTASADEPTYGASSGPNSRPGLTFAGSHKVTNGSFPNVNGTRIGMVGCGIWTAGGGPAFGIGGGFSGGHPFFGLNGSDRMEGTAIFVSGDFQQAHVTDAATTTPHCWAMWMRAASNDAEEDGAAFSTDFSGNAVLDEGTIDSIRMGGDRNSDGTGVLSMFGVMTDPDATKIAAIEAALSTCYGITFT